MCNTETIIVLFPPPPQKKRESKEMKVHTLKPSESFTLGDFYKAQKYKVPGSGHFDKSKCFVLHDNASASAASEAHVGKMATLSTMSNRGDSGGRGANDLQLSVPPNGIVGGDGVDSEVSGGETAGVEAQPPPLQSQWLAGVRMVRAPRKFKATPGSDGVVWILRELCVALHSRRRGLGKHVCTFHTVVCSCRYIYIYISSVLIEDWR